MQSKEFTSAEIEQILEFCAQKGKGCRDCQNMREVKDDVRCGVHPIRLALELNRRKDAELKAVRETLAKVLAETNDDVCSFCAQVTKFELDESLPDDVEGCPFKREKGIAACVCGIVEKQTGWRHG